jgi:hypothetical protein
MFIIRCAAGPFNERLVCDGAWYILYYCTNTAGMALLTLHTPHSHRNRISISKYQ